MPDLTGFKELGFVVHANHGDLYVEKVSDYYRLRFSQGYEPHHPILGKVIDFDIPDGFFMVEFMKTPLELKNFQSELDPLFKESLQRGNYWFLFNPKLDFGTPNISIKAEKLITLLEKAK